MFALAFEQIQYNIVPVDNKTFIALITNNDPLYNVYYKCNNKLRCTITTVA